MWTVYLQYQNNKVLTITIGVLRSSSFRNNLKWLILSKGFDAPKKQVYARLICCVCYFDTLFSFHSCSAKSVECLLLKPNCSPCVNKYFF